MVSCLKIHHKAVTKDKNPGKLFGLIYIVGCRGASQLGGVKLRLVGIYLDYLERYNFSSIVSTIPGILHFM